MNEAGWYNELIKPEWAPPTWIFGPVWSVLYALIFISFGWVFYQIWQQKIPKKLLYPMMLNLLSNAAFTSLQFGLQNNILAWIDILVVLGSLIWFMVAIWPYARWVTYINVPYVLWVSFATILQTTITLLNL